MDLEQVPCFAESSRKPWPDHKEAKTGRPWCQNQTRLKVLRHDPGTLILRSGEISNCLGSKTRGGFGRDTCGLRLYRGFLTWSSGDE